MLGFLVAVLAGQFVGFGADFVRERVAFQPGNFVQSLPDFAETNGEGLGADHGVFPLENNRRTMLQHITHERAPCRIRRGRGATVLRRRLRDMAPAA